MSSVPTELASARSAPTAHLPLAAALLRAGDALAQYRKATHEWCFELEADCTIPAEYILMNHFLGELEPELEAKLATYIRERQLDTGGWPLYTGGHIDPSCTTKAYYALKLVGDDPAAPHMKKARVALLEAGGAARCNVFTRITLALFGQVPWRAVPFIPVEHMLLPSWFAFHIQRISYWSRTVLVPLAILTSLKPRANNPRAIDVAELFRIPPETECNYFARSPGWLGRLFLMWDRAARLLEPLTPGILRRYAIYRSVKWIIPRLNGTHGLGGIFPAMVNVSLVLAVLGRPAGSLFRRQARAALHKLIVEKEDRAYCQPCLSPTWDTALAVLALHETNPERYRVPVRRGLAWLAKSQQTKDTPGDWREGKPGLAGGGWPFQYRNDFYPDLDDTPMAAWAMSRAAPGAYRENVRRAGTWVRGMQSNNGGFGSFDANNTDYYLNAIPFADHGALMDPPTSDVTARCLIQLCLEEGGGPDEPRNRQAIRRALAYVRNEQEQDGSWFGRWGTNYIYGTWSVLTALEVAGEDPRQDYVRRAVNWLKSVQQADGGWGESNDTYLDPSQAGMGQPSTSYQTAWALLALMAAGEVHSAAVRRGVHFLLGAQQDGGLWHDDSFTAPGFPRVFYLRYHGYSCYFPLWALARYRNLGGQQG